MLRIQNLSRAGIYKLAGIAVILLAYSPGVFRESFWSDDYPYLMDTSGSADHVLRDGRPTSAALISMSFSLIKNPSNAWILRALALIGMLLLFHLISKKLEGSVNSPFAILAIAIAFCLPSFQMYIHWSTAWSYMWTALAGLKAFDLWSSDQRTKKIVAVILLTLALTTYPPAALIFFSVIVVANVVNESSSLRMFSETIKGIWLLILSLLTSFVAVFVVTQLGGVSLNQRVNFVSLSQIPAKISWLITRPLVVGLRPFAIDSPAPKIAILTSIPVLLILFIGILRQSRKTGEHLALRAIAIVFPLMITLAPIVVSSDNQIEFRVLPGYCWGVATIAIFFLLVEIQSRVNETTGRELFGRYVGVIAVVLVGVVAILSVQSHYRELVGDPYQKKNAFLNGKIDGCVAKGSTKSFVILPPSAPFKSHSRLGIFSMSTDLASPWVPKPNVETLLRERQIGAPVSYIEVRPSAIIGDEGACIIDLEDFRKVLG